MSYKRLTPCILDRSWKAVKWFDDRSVIARDVVALAKHLCRARGGRTDRVRPVHIGMKIMKEAIDLMRKINRFISIPMVAGGNIRREEDVKKYLYAGAKRAILNFSKIAAQEMLESVSKRFGKERIAVSLNDFDALFKQQHLIEEYASELIFMHRLDLDSVMNITSIPVWS